VRIAFALAASILAINLWVERPLLDSMLFVLAIAVGLTPELLPAIVTISLAMGSRRLAERSVIVKRLVAIEDLGNIEVLFTDKTGTLTKGELTFRAAIDGHGQASSRILALGLACHDEVIDERRGRNPLDRALREAHESERLRRGWQTIAVAPPCSCHFCRCCRRRFCSTTSSTT
jgi:Mg2+-importing ATPase